jgi:glycosyltransferase involved in cell wall biosynthesis
LKEKEKKRIFWVSFLNIDFSNIISQTQIIEKLTQHGFIAHLFTTGNKKKLYQKYTTTCIRLAYLPVISPLIYLSVLMVYLPFLILKKRPSFIVLEPTAYIIGLALTPITRILRIKIIMDIRTTPVDPLKNFSAYLRSISFRTSILIAKTKFDGITILTEMMKDEICSEYGIERKFVGVVSSGVSTDLFNPIRYNSQQLREEFGLKNEFLIFYHGAMGEGRSEGIIATIKSFLLLKNSVFYKLFLLGEPSVTIKKTIEENNLDKYVLIQKRVPYEIVPRLIAMCDIGIVPLSDSPKWRNQSPLKLLEYLSMGKPVIVTDILAHRNILADDKSGIYINSIEPSEIAKAISYAYENRCRLNKWGLSGRKIVESSYSWDKVAFDFEAFLKNLDSTENID